MLGGAQRSGCSEYSMLYLSVQDFLPLELHGFAEQASHYTYPATVYTHTYTAVFQQYFFDTRQSSSRRDEATSRRELVGPEDNMM